jgi:hypothetical protein
MNLRRISPLFYRGLITGCLIGFIGIALFMLTFIPAVEAASPLVASSVQVGTSSYNTRAGLGATGHESCYQASQATFYIVWLYSFSGSSGAHNLQFNFYYTYSTNGGSTWAAAALLFTTAVNAAVTGLNGNFVIACNGQGAMVVSWETSGLSYSAPLYSVLAVSGSSVIQTTSDTQVTCSPACGTGHNGASLAAVYGPGGDFVITWLDQSTSNMWQSDNGVCVTNTGGTGCSVLNVSGLYGLGPAFAFPQALNYQEYVPSVGNTWTTNYEIGTSAVAMTAGRQGGYGVLFSPSSGPYANTLIFATPAGSSSASSGTQCYLEVFNTVLRTWTESTPSGIPSAACGENAGVAPFYNGFAGALGNVFWMIVGLSSTGGTLMYSTDGLNSFGSLSFTMNSANALMDFMFATLPGGIYAGVLTEVDGSGNVYAQLITTGSFSTTGSQTASIGACGVTVQHGTYLTNGTQVWYSGNALGAQAVNQIQVEVSQVKGSVSQPLAVMLYATASANYVFNAQQPSVSNPASMIYYIVYNLSPGTKNQTITINVSVPLNSAVNPPLPFNFYAVALLGTDHVAIVNSALSGLTTQSGGGVPAAPTLQFTTGGSTSSTKLAFCATSQYQGVLVQTQTQVSTVYTSGGTVTVTNTATVTGTNPNVIGNNNFMLAIVVVLGPALALAGFTKSLWGGMLGAVLGIAVGWYINIPNIWALTSFVSLALVALLFLGNKNVGGAGGGGL